MTKIIRMEMKGFKSFAQKTEVVFGDNFNCILGPNGSGKSNVLDSLCFVLGKAGAKGLRVEKSGNLIYNGGKTKKPSKEGEVSIWFDNSSGVFPREEKEIKITRLIKQSGQGVYKINDQTTTRTQIIELLSHAHINPDGYNIILQGDIVRLIEMTPNERRLIIEEIAGINIYEDKKQKALRELGRVEEKLNEADIILAERESYLKELKKDRDKAQKYRDLEDKRRRNKKTIIVSDMKERNEQLAKLDIAIGGNEEKIKGIEEEISKLREKIDERKKQIEDINHEVEEKGEKEQVKLHKIVEELKVTVAVNKQRLETLDNELEKLKNRQDELKASHGELQGKTKELEKKKVELEKRVKIREQDRLSIDKKIADFKKKHDLEAESDTDSQIDTIDKELEAIQVEMNDLREEQQNLFREKDRVDLQLQTIDDKLEKLANLTAEHKKEIEALKQKKKEFKNATVELSKLLAQSADIASQLATARSKAITKREELGRLEARQANITERLSAGSGLQAVLDLRKKDKSIHGTVAELGNVSKDYSVALEIAAGNKIKSIVVETDATAASCIKFLKDKKLGVATFLPMNKIRSPPIDPTLRKLKGSGIKGLALDLIKFNPKYQKIFEYVFGNTLVVDSVATARKIGVGKVRMVTLTGDIIDLSGAMQGGHRQQRASGLFGQEEVAKQIEQLNADLADTETIVARLESQAHENEEVITRLRALKAELEGDIIKTEKSLHLDSGETDLDKESKKQLKGEAKELDKKIDDVGDTIAEKNKSFAKLKIERQQLRDKITALRNPAKLAELKSLEEKRMELSQEIIQLQGELKHSITETETIIGPEGRKIFEILKQHEKEAESFKAEKKKVQEEIKVQEADLKSKEKQEAKFYAQFKELFQKRSKLQDEVNKSEHKIVEKNSTQRNLEMKNNALGLDRARIRAELAGLEEEDKEYKDVEPFTSKSRDVIKRELSEFDRMTLELGAVNMRALEIYEEVEQEYAGLLEKKETLRVEREDVLIMMNEIDSKKKDLFMKTFDALQANFKRIFTSLLSKGEAGIVLENANDPFAGGVEIKVRLTGKRFLDIRSLSGGEKTMTALAFLFAVQEYEPASFYVLDEVDAALDKKNSKKLADLIRGYCNNAQYVVISHNDGVISEADNLYGVSMNEHGMSKVTTLKI